MSELYKGYRAVVTGASSGIGESIAKQLAAMGIHLVLVARRKEKLEALRTDLEKRHSIQVECLSLDLCKSEDIRNVFPKSTAGGKTVQILVNNAGIGPYGDFLKGSLETHLNTVRLNTEVLTGLSYEFSQHMLAQNQPCFILNLSSVISYQGTKKFAVYAATKSYVRIFSEILGGELESTGVSVSCLCPGGTYTEFLEKNGQDLKESGRTYMMSSDDVARIGVEGMFTRQRVIVPGVINKAICLLPRFFPSRWALKIASRSMQKSVNEKN